MSLQAWPIPLRRIGDRNRLDTALLWTPEQAALALQVGRGLDGLENHDTSA